MKLANLPIFALLLTLLLAVSGCGGVIKKAEYPSSWPHRPANSENKCIDITGSYIASSDLPFFLFGITNENSLDWASLVRIYEERLLHANNDIKVTIRSQGPDQIEIIVDIHGMTIAKQLLLRSHQSENTAIWFGQHEKSFRCEPDGIVINSSFIHDWDAYTLPYEEKKSRYRRPHGGAVGPVGVSEGYFYFSKSSSGSLVMRAALYGCYACTSLDEYWRQWEPIFSQIPK